MHGLQRAISQKMDIIGWCDQDEISNWLWKDTKLWYTKYN